MKWKIMKKQQLKVWDPLFATLEHVPDFYTSIKALHAAKSHTGAQVLIIDSSD